VIKFGSGLLFGAAGLALASLGAHDARLGEASPAWLVGTYFLLAVGEVLLSPIGLSAAARFAPAGKQGFATGVYFLSLALGGLLAGMTGGLFDLRTAVGLATACAAIAAVLGMVGALFLTVRFPRRAALR
jgi:POT family proton-dependent oligopeptide transporter